MTSILTAMCSERQARSVVSTGTRWRQTSVPHPEFLFFAPRLATAFLDQFIALETSRPGQVLEHAPHATNRDVPGLKCHTAVVFERERYFVAIVNVELLPNFRRQHQAA